MTSSISDGVSGRAGLQCRTIGWDDQQISMPRRVPRRWPLAIDFHYNFWKLDQQITRIVHTLVFITKLHTVLNYQPTNGDRI